MKEEIKEILDYIDDRIIPNEKWNKIKDCIINLQEENKQLKEKNYLLIDYQDMEIRYNEYKQRNEKATEYIIDNCVLSDEWKDLGFCNFIPTGRIKYKQLSKTKVKYLLNILKGDKMKEIKFIEYSGIKGYIELMKHDVEPLNNPEIRNIELYYSGRDIKAVLDYITNLQKENKKLLKKSYSDDVRITKAIEKLKTLIPICIMPNNTLIHGTEKARTIEETLNILKGDEDE